MFKVVFLNAKAQRVRKGPQRESIAEKKCLLIQCGFFAKGRKERFRGRIEGSPLPVEACFDHFVAGFGAEGEVEAFIHRIATKFASFVEGEEADLEVF